MTTETNTPRILEDLSAIAEAVALAPDIVRARSVVKPTYKLKYAQRVVDGARGKKGVSKKAQARSCGDWLALELAALTLDEKNRLDVDAFCAILTANGVKHDHWNTTTKGWQGRFRMTGRLALQRVVAAEEQLFLADGTAIAAPRSWVAKHQH